MGVVYIFDSRCSEACEDQMAEEFVVFSFFLTSAFQIVMTLQLFNWFSKRKLGIVIGLWLLFQGFGLMAKFVLLHQWSNFPDFQKAEDSGSEVVG